MSDPVEAELAAADRASRRSSLPVGSGLTWLLPILTLMAALPGAAQTLDQAMVDAYETSPQLAAAQAALRAIDEKVPQALSNYRPSAQLLGEGGLVRLTGLGNTEIATAGDDLSFFSREAYGVRLSQPVYRGGRTGAEIDAAMHEIESARARLVATEQAVLLAAVADYADIVADQSKVELTRGYERDTAKFLDDTRGRLKFGAVTETDVAQAESAAERATADRLAAAGALAVARTIYQRDTGKAPGVLAAPAGHPVLPGTEDELLSAAENDNPAVIAAGYAKHAAEDDIDVADGALLPTLSLDASVLHEADVARFGIESGSLVVGRAPVTDYRIVAQLVVPLYDGGKSYSVSRQARQVASQRQSELDLARRDAQNEAESAWEQLAAVRANVATDRQAVSAFEAALDGVTHEAAIGQRTVIDVVNAQAALFRSRLDLVDAERDQVVKEYAVAASIGQLTAKAMGLPARFYDPTEHFEAVRDKWFGLGMFDRRAPSEAPPEEPQTEEGGLPAVASVTLPEQAAGAEPAVVQARGAPPPPPAVEAAPPSGNGGTTIYSRVTSVAELPNETMEYRNPYGSLRTNSDGYDERTARDRHKLAAEAHAKWMEYGGEE